MTKLIGLDFETVLKETDKGKIHTFFSFQVYTNDFGKIREFGTIRESQFINFQNYLTDKYKGVWFIVYNLSFDGIILSQILKNTDYKTDMFIAGSRVISMTISKGKTRWFVKDLRNILPSKSLDSLGKQLGIEKMEKPSYLGKGEPQTPEEWNYFRQYAMRDAEICYIASKEVQNNFKMIKSTSAGIAIRVFKRDFVKLKKFPKYTDDLNQKFRLAYHGGRTECFIRGTNQNQIREYDVNSLYPYVMSVYDYPFPIKGYVYKSNVNLDYEGIARAKVMVNHHVPPLCTKIMGKDKIEKLVFPIGKFEGWFTYPELRTLEEYNVGKILQVYESFEWQNKFNPFKEYVKYFYGLRNQNKDKNLFYKLMLNSLYGKFGEHGNGRVLTIENGEVTEEKPLAQKRKWYHCVPIAAYITSYARLELWRMMQKIKAENLYYCDTDSIHTTQSLNHWVGKDLGNLKLEDTAKIREAIYLRAKFYWFKNHLTMKGFAQNLNMYYFKAMLISGNFEIAQHRILKVLEAQRLGKKPLYDYNFLKKVDLQDDGKRVYDRKLEKGDLLLRSSYSKPIELKV